MVLQMHTSVPVKSIYGLLISTPYPHLYCSSTGTVRSNFKRRTLLRKEEGIIHLFIDMSIIGNDQDQFQGHVFKRMLNDQRNCII